MACGRGVTGAAQGHGRCHSPVTSGRDSLGRVQARSSPGDRARTQASRQAAGHAWLGLEVNARGNAQSFCTIIRTYCLVVFVVPVGVRVVSFIFIFLDILRHYYHHHPCHHLTITGIVAIITVAAYISSASYTRREVARATDRDPTLTPSLLY